MGGKCDAPGLMSVEQARQIIFQNIQPLTDRLTLPLQEILGQVLCEDIISGVDVPAFDNSAMDGYALRYADLKTTNKLKQVGKSFAGHAFERVLGQGECVRIMTGAVIPKGADTVVMQENTTAESDCISITGQVRPGEAIRATGSDIAKNSRVLKANKRLSAIDVGLLASLGIEQVEVYRKLRVAVFSSGDELVTAGREVAQGQLFDSNRPMLIAMLSQLGCEVLDLGIVPDDKALLRQAFDYADQHADCVITSGGVSVGEADYTREVLEKAGKVDFWKLAIKPGKPLAFGRLANSLFFGLPGNPVSTAVTFEHIAAPALRLMAGEIPQAKLSLVATAKRLFRKKPGRTDYQRAQCYRDEQGKLWVEAAGSQSSGVLSGFISSNCYAVLENQRGNVKAGELVSVQLFSQLLA